MYDAIVIGARAAGSPTAMLLAKAGLKVLLVDRSRFPSDIMSTHYIHKQGVASLKRWGLLDAVIASDTPACTEWTFDVGPFALRGTTPRYEDIDVDYCPRRNVLDKILVDGAAAAGAEVREGFSVQEILMSGDRVTGIRGRSGTGAMVTEDAKIVIGADGRHSFVARSVQAQAYESRPSRTCVYYSYFSGVPMKGVELYPRPGSGIVAMYTTQGQACLAAVKRAEDFHVYRDDIEDTFWSVLQQAPDLYERARAGTREERWTGTVDLPFFFRKPYGPGWALVGDASYHQDPNLGQGISNAFRDAEALSAAITSGLDNADLDSLLAGYEETRNRLGRPFFEYSYMHAGLEPPPAEMAQLLGAIQGNPEAISQFLGTISGAVNPAEFFSPENAGRLMGVPAGAA
jgi:2-polyprenyl-6-methoxyphenol hydroxylase-like FAD-dependent oxidoreductase